MKAERESEKREYQLQLDMLRANLEQRQPNAPSAPRQERQFLDGMKEDDIPNVGELRREWDQKEAMYQSRLEELQVAQQHPDYAEVIEKFALPLVQKKPHLAEGIQGSRTKHSSLTSSVKWLSKCSRIHRYRHRTKMLSVSLRILRSREHSPKLADKERFQRRTISHLCQIKSSCAWLAKTSKGSKPLEGYGSNKYNPIAARSENLFR